MVCFNCLNFGHHRLHCPNECFLGCHRCLTLGHVSRDCLAPRPVPLEATNAPSAARKTSQALYAGDQADASPIDSDTPLLAPALAGARSSQEVSVPVDSAAAGPLGLPGLDAAPPQSDNAARLMTAEEWSELFNLNISDSFYSFSSPRLPDFFLESPVSTLNFWPPPAAAAAAAVFLR
jgi:hypothetical protein